MAVFHCTCGASLGNYENEQDGRNAVIQHQRNHSAGIEKQEPRIEPQPDGEPRPAAGTSLGRPAHRR